jgi:hypothetical protein
MLERQLGANHCLRAARLAGFGLISRFGKMRDFKSREISQSLVTATAS